MLFFRAQICIFFAVQGPRAALPVLKTVSANFRTGGYEVKIEYKDEEIYLIIEKRADRLMDIFSETAHAYIKNGMRLGAHLLLQLLNLE